MRAYYARKRTMVAWSLGIGIAAGLALVAFSLAAALAEVSGSLCGILNALLSMRSNERLVEHRFVALFVISSVLRIVVFGIVPVEFALHGPWWTIGTYFLGFFVPLAVYALSAARELRPD